MKGVDLMKLEILKLWRTIIPGIFIFLLYLLFTTNDVSQLKSLNSILSNVSLSDGVYFVVFIVLGVLYYCLNFRNWLWKPYLNKVKDNIKDKLLQPYADDLLLKDVNFLKEDRKLMNVFYHFIDNDESLKEKAKRVRVNGLIWTSFIDFTIISFLWSIAFFIKHCMNINYYTFNIAFLLLFSSIISLGLVSVITRRHISMSDEQLDMITQKYKEELKKEIDKLLQ